MSDLTLTSLGQDLTVTTSEYLLGGTRVKFLIKGFTNSLTMNGDNFVAKSKDSEDHPIDEITFTLNPSNILEIAYYETYAYPVVDWFFTLTVASFSCLRDFDADDSAIILRADESYSF